MQRLAELGQQVRALARAKARRRIRSGDVEVVSGDFNDVDSLRQATDGCRRCHCCRPGTICRSTKPTPSTRPKEAGTQLVVKHSIAGAQSKAVEMGRWHRAGEEQLEDLRACRTVFLRNAAFATNALGWTPTIKAQNAVYRCARRDGTAGNRSGRYRRGQRQWSSTSPGHEGRPTISSGLPQ